MFLLSLLAAAESFSLCSSHDDKHLFLSLEPSLVTELMHSVKLDTDLARGTRSSHAKPAAVVPLRARWSAEQGPASGRLQADSGASEAADLFHKFARH